MNNPQLQSSSNPPQPNLLVVDDRPDNLQVLSQLLRERYQVRVAMGGDIALKAIEIDPPDLILLDILMPRMDGYEVCTRLKQDPKTRDIPVLFLSALARGEDKVRGFQVGGADYITKPFQTEEVIARIEHQLAIRALQRQLEGTNRELAQGNRQLEAQIQQRQQAEAALQQQNTQLERTLAQLQALQSEVILREKMTALGRLVVGMTGEMNDPLTVIQAGMRPIRDVLADFLWEFPQFFDRLSAAQQVCFIDLIERAASTPPPQTKEQRQLKRQLVQQLEALDIEDADSKLASTIAELGVDVESIAPLLPDGDRILPVARTLVKARRSLDNIDRATRRADGFLKALGNYAGRDFSQTPAISDIREGLELVISLFRYRLPANVALVANYSSLPLIRCYPDELSQVWTNLIENALSAMGDRGILTVETAVSEGWVRVSFADSRGEGAIVPTFDANPNAQIDLYICEKIVQKHNGTISVERVGEQTKFTVSLPIA